MTICGIFVWFCFLFFVIRPHYYAETLSTYYDEEVVIGEGMQGSFTSTVICKRIFMFFLAKF